MVDRATPYGSRRPRSKHSLERSSNRAQRAFVSQQVHHAAQESVPGIFGPDAPVSECPLVGGGLNRSPQHFILEGKDGVWDGTEIS